MKKFVLNAIICLTMAITAQAQNITVQGTVVSASDSEPLIGASVVSSEKGTMGVATDFDGKFSISVPKG